MQTVSQPARTEPMIRDDEGYQIFDGVFATSEMRDVLDQISGVPFDRTRAGARHLLGVPVVRQLAKNLRMLKLAGQFVGPGATPFRATLFDKSAQANWLVPWHQDTALPLRRRLPAQEWGPWSTKGGVLYAHAPAWALEQVVALRVCLDDSSNANGPLRVLPETHQLGVLTDAQIKQLARDRSAVACVASSGGVVAMRPLTVHASSKALLPQRRRVLHIEYVAAADLDVGIDVASA
jgi:hypothetical protein